MNKTFSAVAIIAGLLGAPLAASAASAWHQGNGDVVTFTPEHVGSGRTRADADGEVAAARQAGTLALYQKSASVTVKSTSAAKTRAQVIEEMRNQTPEELKAQKELFGG